MTATFRTTDEPTLEMSKTLGRYEGGRSDQPTLTMPEGCDYEAYAPEDMEGWTEVD